MSANLAKIFKQAGLPVYGQPTKGAQTQPIRKEPKIAKVDALRTAAKNYPCVLCGRAKKFTIPAHCDDVRAKGIGKKAPGYMLAYVCGNSGGCHDKIDGRAGGLTKEAKRALWLEAYWLTVQIWFRDGLVIPA